MIAGYCERICLLWTPESLKEAKQPSALGLFCSAIEVPTSFMFIFYLKYIYRITLPFSVMSRQ
jgi:hypothetical protein